MKNRSKKRGFSLAEILVAIAILAVVAAVVIPSIGGQLKSGDEGRIQQDLANIRTAAEQFLADVRRYPKSVGQLINRPVTPLSDTSLVGGIYSANQKIRWRGPYLTKDSMSTVRTGFDATISGGFTEQLLGGQGYLTIQLLAFDTASARGLDRKMDDGAEAAGMIQWAYGSATTTLKYYALPIQ